MRSLGWVLIRCDWCPHGKKRLGHTQLQKEDCVKTHGEGGHLHASERTQKAPLLRHLDLSLPDSRIVGK